jgi:ABC-type branched-subunit amino acid transport system ATPase component
VHVRPDGGQVLLRGDRIDDLGENRLSALRRKRFGFVFQFGQSLPELPAAENVALAFVMLVIVAACLGSGTRADRTAWRSPAPERPRRRARTQRSRTRAMVRSTPLSLLEGAR